MPVVTIDLHIHIVEIPLQLRMNSLNMVILVERIHRGLPVAIPFDRDIALPRHPLEMIGVQVLGDNPEIVLERTGIRVQ